MSHNTKAKVIIAGPITETVVLKPVEFCNWFCFDEKTISKTITYHACSTVRLVATRKSELLIHKDRTFYKEQILLLQAIDLAV